MKHSFIARVRLFGQFCLSGLTLIAAMSGALACSTLVLGLPDRPLIAYSFDFAATSKGFVTLNPEGLRRRSVLAGNSAVWTSRFGSLTFTQLGPGMPAAGMNDAGLVVTLMWNADASYQRESDRPAVTELEAIQYLLDTSASVDEAAARIAHIQVEGLVPIHYLLADRHGDTAVLLPGRGGLVTFAGKDLPIPALTNTSYDLALDFLRAEERIDRAPPGRDLAGSGPGSLERFARAASAIQTAGPVPKQSEGFAVLDALANFETRWQILFDPSALKIAFRHQGHDRTTHFDFASFDFQCRTPQEGLALDTLAQKADVSDLSPLAGSDLIPTAETVLTSLAPTADMGSNLAENLAQALLMSPSCEN